MATSYYCRCSSTMVMKNYTIDTKLSFSLSISQLLSLTTLIKCFSNFSLSEKLFTLLLHKPLGLPFYRYKRKPKKKGLKYADTRFESHSEATTFPLKLWLPKN